MLFLSSIPSFSLDPGDAINIALFCVWVVVLIVSIVLTATKVGMPVYWFGLGAVINIFLSSLSVDWFIQLPVFIVASVISILLGFMVFDMIKKYRFNNCNSLLFKKVSIKELNTEKGTDGIITIKGTKYEFVNLDKNDTLSQKDKIIIKNIFNNKLFIEKVK